MKERPESRNPGFRSSPGGAAADGGQNLRTASCGILTRQERRCVGIRTPAFPKVRNLHIPPRPVCENSPKPGFRLSARACRQKTANLEKAAGEIEKSVPPPTARAPAGMTVRLEIRGPGEPRKPKAGTPERNKTRLKNYPPFRGIFITPVSASLPEAFGENPQGFRHARTAVCTFCKNPNKNATIFHTAHGIFGRWTF